MALILDEERFDMAQALYNERKSRKSPASTLQKLCMDFLINKAAAIISGWKKSGENVFDLLPNNLRTDMLNYLPLKAYRKIVDKEMRRVQVFELMEMLMSHETVKLDIERSVGAFQRLISQLDELQKILVTVARRSPKLQYFAIKGYSLDEDPEAENLMSPRLSIPYLLQLKDLAHLEIFGFWFWKNDDLSNLFSHLKQLVFLKILLHKKVTASGFREVHHLKKLEEFHFLVETHKEEYRDEGTLVSNYEWIYSYCAENVRSLKLIGGTLEDCVDVDEGVHFCSDLKQISPSIKGTSNLECLHTKSVLPKAEFPNLQYLVFRGPLSMNPENFLGKMASFTHLSNLYLADMTYDVITKMLEFVGKQLVTLYVDNEDTMDFFQVLYLCPNLAKFQQMYTVAYSESYKVVQQSKYRALVTQHNVRLLKDFHAVFCKGEKVEGLFELILFAPLLEHLALENPTVSKAECQLVHAVLEGQFLNLKSLYLSGLDLDASCALDDFGLFVQFLVCSAPRLFHLEFYWRDTYLSKKWDSEQTVAESFRKLTEL